MPIVATIENTTKLLKLSYHFNVAICLRDCRYVAILNTEGCLALLPDQHHFDLI